MVFKIRIRLRNYAFLSSVVLSFVLLFLATPAILNFDEFFGIGYFRTDKDYRTTYSDGYGEVNMDLQLERSREYRYSYYLSCYFSSGEDVVIIGMTRLNYTISVKGSIISYREYDFDPLIEQYTRVSTVLLRKDEPIVWSGSAEVLFLSNSIVQNETIEFILGITIPLSEEDYYNMDLTSYVGFFLWVIAFIMVPVILNFIFQPNFGVPLDEEMRKKHKKYFDFFKKNQEEQS